MGINNSIRWAQFLLSELNPQCFFPRFYLSYVIHSSNLSSRVERKEWSRLKSKERVSSMLKHKQLFAVHPIHPFFFFKLLQKHLALLLRDLFSFSIISCDRFRLAVVYVCSPWESIKELFYESIETPGHCELVLPVDTDHCTYADCCSLLYSREVNISYLFPLFHFPF